MRDIRLLRTYSLDGPLDVNFIRDTIFHCIKSRDTDDEETSKKLRDLHLVVEAKDWNTTLELAQSAADLIISEAMTFRQKYAIARILGCDEKASRGDEPHPELNEKKLLDQINAFFVADWETVSKGKKKPSSAIEWTLVGDAISLQTHLENLQALKNEADGQPGEENVSQALTSELKEKYNRMPCLNLAVYLNHPSCVRVLLECIAKVGPEFSKKVMKWRNGHGYCACFMAIYNNNLECILDIIRGGFDFFDLNLDVGCRTCAFAYLVSTASADSERYLKNFKIILSELQKDPKFDVNMKIPERRRSWDDFDFMRRMAQLDVDDDEDVRRGDGDDTHDDLMQHLFSSSRLSNARENNDNNNEIDHQEENTNPLTATFQRLRGVVRRMRTSDAGDEAAEQREEERAVDEGEANAEDGDDDHDGIDQSITVLNLAARHGGIEILNILLDLGAIAQDDALHDTVNYIESLTNPIRYSGLSMPDIAAGMACLEALLDAGADVNAEHPVTKMTPLHVAAEGTCHEVLSLLLQRGADPGKRTASGETAAEIAEYHDDSHAVDILNRFSRLQRLSTFNRSASQRERESQENNTEELAEELVCVACLTERKGVILAPCGHKVLCRRCTRRLFTRPEQERKCPLCRQKLESFVVQIFDT